MSADVTALTPAMDPRNTDAVSRVALPFPIAALVRAIEDYCREVERQGPAPYRDQAVWARRYIDDHREALDANDNRRELRARYPFLGPLVTLIRGL